REACRLQSKSRVPTQRRLAVVRAQERERSCALNRYLDLGIDQVMAYLIARVPCRGARQEGASILATPPALGGIVSGEEEHSQSEQIRSRAGALVQLRALQASSQACRAVWGGSRRRTTTDQDWFLNLQILTSGSLR